MREVISIHIGGAGVSIGALSWQSLSQEHNLPPFSDQLPEALDSAGSMFAQRGKGYAPRALFVDCDWERIEALRNCDIAGIIGEENVAAGRGDSGGVYSYYHSPECLELAETALNRFSSLAEDTNQLSSIILTGAVSGGCSSALTPLLLSRLYELYPKKSIYTINLLPNLLKSTNVVEPYNSAFAFQSLIENSYYTVLHDNEALQRLSSEVLKIPNSNYSHMNKIAARAFSDVTATYRFESGSNVDQLDCASLLPYPQAHFAVQSINPWCPQSLAYYKDITAYEVGLASINPANCLSSCALSGGISILASLSFRGRFHSEEVQRLQRDLQLPFANWSPWKIRIGGTPCPGYISAFPHSEPPPVSASLLANSTAVRSLFQLIADPFGRLMQRGAYMHWFDGVEKWEFAEAQESVRTLIEDYTDLETN